MTGAANPGSTETLSVEGGPARPDIGMCTYPVNLRLGGRPVLVVGAGRVAARKVAGLLDAGGVVTVVAPEIGAVVERLAAADRIAVERRAYRPGEATAYRLVITATGDVDVDGAVWADADAAGVWVNSADDPERCSFILPAIHRDGSVSVAVSSGGASPALASWLRNRIAAEFGDGLGALAFLLGEARREVHASGCSTESVDWRSLLDGPLPELVAEGELVEARRLIEAVIDGPPP